MTYQETLAYLSRLGRFGMKLGTQRTRAILDRLDGADRRLNGEPISEADFVQTFDRIKPVLDEVAAELGQATEFEMLTAMAIAYLAPRVDELVCEVGLGGRLDATNALDLGLAVITNVDLDHQKYLGNTIEEIANEKAAIIKPGNRVITGCEGVALAVVEEHARRAGAEVWRLGREITLESKSQGWSGHVMSVSGPGFAYENLELALVGDYQPANAALAVASAHLMDRVADDAVRRGLAAVVWPGRLQVVGRRPRVILDGGHNPAAMTKAGASLRALIGDERLVALFAMLSERDPHQLFVALRTLAPDAVVFTAATGAAGHAVDPVQLASIYGPGGEAASHPAAALARAKHLAGADGNVLVCGSLYLVGEVLAMAQQPTSQG